MQDLEELADTLSQRLWLLQLHQLKEVCILAKISCGNVTTRQALIRLIITESLDSTISTEDEDVALYFLKSILKSVEQIKETDEDTETVENAENTEQDIQQMTTEIAEMSLAEKYSQLQQNSQALQDVRRLRERVNSASLNQPSAPRVVPPAAVNRLPEVIIRKIIRVVVR